MLNQVIQYLELPEVLTAIIVLCLLTILVSPRQGGGYSARPSKVPRNNPPKGGTGKSRTK